MFVCHLPALLNGATARMTYVNTFKTWRNRFTGPKLVGGDFNESPTFAATSLKVELKAGTSVPEVGVGSVYWDNVRVTTNCR